MYVVSQVQANLKFYYKNRNWLLLYKHEKQQDELMCSLIPAYMQLALKKQNVVSVVEINHNPLYIYNNQGLYITVYLFLTNLRREGK